MELGFEPWWCDTRIYILVTAFYTRPLLLWWIVHNKQSEEMGELETLPYPRAY